MMAKVLRLAIWFALCFWIGMQLSTCHAETMLSSYYGAESGTRTASGATFHPNGLTAAHRSLPFGTVLRVCYRRCAVVRVTDRGPFIRGRDLDLSHGAAGRIGMLGVGVARVSVQRL